jgi:hypothetical protein
MSITKDWAISYCNRLIVDNNINFPFQLGRKKVGGYVDASSHIKNEEEFYTAYSEFNDHPRCAAILLYHDLLSVPLSV